MKKEDSTSKAGRPKYMLEIDDKVLAEKMASHGYSMENIAKALNISEKTLYNLLGRDSDFLQCIKKGVVNHCLLNEEKYSRGEILPSQYIYWSKTKWKNFYPHEEKPQLILNTKLNLTDSQALAILDITKNDLCT